MKRVKDTCTESALSLADNAGGSQWRRRLFSLVQGQRVLEVGVGSGRNIPHYPTGPQFWAIDVDRDRLEKAREEAHKRSLTVHFMQMDVEALAFPTAFFDCVVGSLVFCEVNDPVAGLREVARVCRPGGPILLLEHMRSRGPMGLGMDFLNLFTSRLLGENINRRTLENVQRAGIGVDKVENLWLNVVKLIIGRVEHPNP